MIADPATGRDLAASALGNWASSPEKCADETLCVTARVDQHDGTSIDSPYRIDTRTGATGFEQGATGFRSLGGGLTDPLQRDPELIEMRSPGRTDWSKPLAELFGDGLTTDDGWVFNQFGEVTVGTLNRPVATVQRQVQFHRNLAEDLVTAAFTTKTGALLWRRSGADVSCMNQLSINSPNGDAAPIWCRYAGTVDARYPTGPQSKPTISHPGLAVTLEQFDPATGRPVWTRPLGASEQLAGLEPGGAVRLLSDHEIRVADGSVPTLVDLSTGAVSEPRSGMEFWCPVHPDVIQSPTPDPGQTQPSTRSGDQVQLCDGTGVVSSVVPTFVPLNVSRAWRQLRLVSTPVGVIAYG